VTCDGKVYSTAELAGAVGGRREWSPDWTAALEYRPRMPAISRARFQLLRLRLACWIASAD